MERAKLGYIHMGELAYRVAEQANGEQTIEEIAVAVSAAVQRPVSVHDVQALIHTVLMPRGVLHDPTGQWPADDDADDAAADESESGQPSSDPRRTPPAVTAGERRPPRETVIGPQPLEAAASILMWLFWPPVMLVITGIALTELLWLFGMHGLAPSIIAVLSAPILLPLVLVLAVVVAAAQPLGAMIALYGYGGTILRLRIVRSLRHPGLHVDVDNDYGLSRWARLIVNVSGIYLQLVLALLICLVGIATGVEFLYLSVALITLNILRLLLPFGAPNADRLLADLLLVQHPLRYAEQALEGYLPGLSSSPRSLPPLKRWGYVAIGLYLAAVIVALAYVVLAFLWVTPTLVATTVDALLAYLGGMAEAVGARNAVGFIGSLVNAALIGLTSFVLAVGLVVALRRLILDVRAWSLPSPQRRRLSMMGAGVAAVLLLLFWLPVSGFAASDDGRAAAPRSLAGATWASLTPMSRGVVSDLLRGS